MIEINQYRIDSDSRQFILTEKKRHPKDHDKTPNKEYLGSASYYSSFEQCMNAILNNEMLRLTGSDGVSLNGIRDLLESYGNRVQSEVLKALLKREDNKKPLDQEEEGA